MNAKAARKRRRQAVETKPGIRPSSIARTVQPLAMLGKDDARLRQRCELVTDEIEAELLPLLPRLSATRKARRGMALALPQVGLMFRGVVTPDTEGNDILVVNPQVQLVGTATELGLEGCLSFPGRWFMVERHQEVKVVGRIAGTREAQLLRAGGLEARMWQHEGDHLDGKVIADHWPESGTTAVLPAGALQRLAAHAINEHEAARA